MFSAVEGMKRTRDAASVSVALKKPKVRATLIKTTQVSSKI